jgi:hypothetical protein
MNAIWIVLKFILANALLIVVSSTLIGFIIRGVLQPTVVNPSKNHKAEWYSISQNRGLTYTIGAIIVSNLLFILLYRYGNLYLILGVLLNMLSRIKDLLVEIKTGIKTTNKTASLDKLDIFWSIISFVGIGIFNYGLYLIWIK